MEREFLQYKISLGGMIRAQNLATKLKRRAVFLVAEKRRRENKGVVLVVHKDEPVRVTDLEAVCPSFVPLCSLPRKEEKAKCARSQRFYEPDVRLIIKSVLEENLNGVKYDSEDCKVAAKMLSNLIKDKVKSLCYDRYKIICIVYIGQSSKQGLQISSLCLFDEEKDNFAEYRLNSDNLFAVGVVYGMYME
ncbi:dynein light chain Tctex-type 5-B-like [Rhopilema esculentum]|uniref:dynein light chain Tctex-type 5-B-like n=1 Tax=Rhopilema esculentum TaxID=499914 RepID=UPI0031DD2029